MRAPHATHNRTSRTGCLPILRQETHDGGAPIHGLNLIQNERVEQNVGEVIGFQEV